MGTGPGGSRYREERVNTSGARRWGRAAAPRLPPGWTGSAVLDVHLPLVGGRGCRCRCRCRPWGCAPEGETLRGRPKVLNPGERTGECDGWLLLQPLSTVSLKIRRCWGRGTLVRLALWRTHIPDLGRRAGGREGSGPWRLVLGGSVRQRGGGWWFGE